MAELKEREKSVLRQLEDGDSHETIARRFNVSVERIRQVEADAKKKRDG